MHQQNESNARNVIYCQRFIRYSEQTLVVPEWKPTSIPRNKSVGTLGKIEI